MDQYTEAEAYKHLLEVTQNIIASLNTQQDIIYKYETLKKSILNKIVPKDNSYHEVMLELYRQHIDSILKCIGLFESQIQGQMNKSNFLREIDPVLQETNMKIQRIQNRLKIGERGQKKQKLSFINELSSFKYSTKQLKGKLENMGLMVQVHNKMHQIILQASDKEGKRSKKQLEYNKRLQEMQEIMSRIVDAKAFLQQCSLLQEKKKKMDIAKKSLMKVLFQN